MYLGIPWDDRVPQRHRIRGGLLDMLNGSFVTKHQIHGGGVKCIRRACAMHGSVEGQENQKRVTQSQ